MKKRLYISNDEAGFFDSNKMLCLDNPPTQGDFIVGDIVISNRQENGVFGWVCVLAGSPGRWEVINDLRLIQEAIEKLEQRQETIVNGDLNTIKKQITQMAEQALILDKEHKDELSKITEKVSMNTTNILNINTELDNIKQTAGNLQGSIDQVVAGINAQVQTNKNNIQINSDRIAVLEGKQVTNEKEIKDIKNVNDQQTADIQGAYDKITKIEQDIVKIQDQAGGQFGDLTAQVATNTENIADMNERLEIVEKDLEDAKVKVNEVETGMKDNCKEIDDIKKGIISALVSSGISANENMSWEELFGLLLQGLVKPEEPIEIITDEITIKVGETYDATKLYTLQEGYTVQYKYSAIIAIEDEHTIVGKEVGTTDLEIICGEIIKNVKVNVIEGDEPEEIPCTNITLNDTTIQFTEKDATKTLVATLYPDDTTDSVTWESSNTNIATVDNNGVVTSKANGSCIITATCGDKSATCDIVVSVACGELTFDIDSLTVGVEAGTYDVAQYINVTPISCQLPVTWSIDETSVATINSNTGVLTPISVGTAVITAQCGDKSATLPLTVHGVDLELSTYSSEMIEGEQHTFYAYLHNGDINKLTVDSSKPDALSIETVIQDETTMSIRVTMLDEQAGNINFYYDANLIETFVVSVRA